LLKPLRDNGGSSGSTSGASAGFASMTCIGRASRNLLPRSSRSAKIVHAATALEMWEPRQSLGFTAESQHAGLAS